MPMVAPAVQGIELFKIAGRSISGWIPGLKTGTASHVRQPFCSQLEERLLLWLGYNPQVVRYARGDIGTPFATTYRLPTPKHAPFAIGYGFQDNPHDYLPDVVGTLTNGKLFIAEAGMEDDKRGDRNQTRAEAARRLARIQRGVFWIGTERTLTRLRHYNLVFLHAQNTTETVGEKVQTAKTPKCTFSGVVSIDLKRFLASGVRLFECPDCARTRTLSPRKGVLRFPSHDKRKISTPNTEQRWAREKTIWEVVGGERT
jgi:hypothetical protein